MTSIGSWKKAGAGSGLKADQVWDPEKQKSIEGIYKENRVLNIEEGREFWLYLIKQNEKVIGVNGQPFLDRLMTEIEIGDEVKITFIENIFNSESDENIDIYTVEHRPVIAS